jgi:threonine synthase
MQVAFKCEFQNPSGSFKDRGSALLVSFIRSRGVESAVEDSSGNAGASFAAYAARAGMKARVFIPDSASGPKRAQIEAYGAEVVSIMGPRSNAAEAVRRAAEDGAVYASHAYLPFNLPGYATVAYEIAEQLEGVPGTVVAPAGQGGLLLGIIRGFVALLKAGVIDRMPVPIGVQARACAPLWALQSYGRAGLAWVAEGQTLAEGIRVSYPLRGDALLQATDLYKGMFLAVDEEDILAGRDALAGMGFYVEPTSAVVWRALGQVAGQVPEPVVLVLTGSGLKWAGS